MVQLHRARQHRADTPEITDPWVRMMTPGAPDSPLDLAALARDIAHPWRAKAACKGQSSAMFPVRGENAKVKAAKALCGACPVQSECLEYALGVEEEEGGALHGFWGGMSPRARRRLAANAGVKRERRVALRGRR